MVGTKQTYPCDGVESYIRNFVPVKYWQDASQLKLIEGPSKEMVQGAALPLYQLVKEFMIDPAIDDSSRFAALYKAASDVSAWHGLELLAITDQKSLGQYHFTHPPQTISIGYEQLEDLSQIRDVFQAYSRVKGLFFNSLKRPE